MSIQYVIFFVRRPVIMLQNIDIKNVQKVSEFLILTNAFKVTQSVFPCFFVLRYLRILTSLFGRYSDGLRLFYVPSLPLQLMKINWSVNYPKFYKHVWSFVDFNYFGHQILIGWFKPKVSKIHNFNFNLDIFCFIKENQFIVHCLIPYYPWMNCWL